MTIYFYLSVALLALMLFFPVSKLVWTLSVRRLQRKMDRELNPEEQQGQKIRARFLSLLLVIGFSWLFNLQLVT